MAATFLTGHSVSLAVGILVGLFFLFSIKVVRQWEKVAVLRFGRFQRLQGPGLFMLTPVVDSLSSFVDQRVRIGTVTAESTLTRDTVPVNVDAIVFWLVWNAEKSILEVANFEDAIAMSAQTALRESIGRHDLEELVKRRLDGLLLEIRVEDDHDLVMAHGRPESSSGLVRPRSFRGRRCRGHEFRRRNSRVVRSPVSLPQDRRSSRRKHRAKPGPHPQ